MTSYTLTIRDKKAVLQRWFVSTACRTTLMVLVAIFGLLYLFEMNSVSATGYDIANLERQVTTLEQENQDLDVHIAHYRSMPSIQDRLASMNLVPVDSVQYVNAMGSIVARR